MLDKLNPMLSSGKRFVARVNKIGDPELLRQALRDWEGKFSHNQRLVIQRRIAELEPRSRKVRKVHHTHRTDLY